MVSSKLRGIQRMKWEENGAKAACSEAQLAIFVGWTISCYSKVLLLYRSCSYTHAPYMAGGMKSLAQPVSAGVSGTLAEPRAEGASPG